MISQVYFIMLPTVTFYLANLLVSYHLSFLLFFIRAPNPLSRWLLEIFWLTGSPEEKVLHFALKLLGIFFGLTFLNLKLTQEVEEQMMGAPSPNSLLSSS